MSSIQDTLKLGWKHQQDGNLELARQCYWSVLAIDYLHGNALHLLGRAEFEAENFEKAASFMEQSVDAEPLNAAFRHNLGLVYARLERMPEARGCFEEAIRLKPDYADAHNNLANVLAAEGEFDKAIAAYREALRLNPAFSKAQDNLNELLNFQKLSGSRPKAED